MRNAVALSWSFFLTSMADRWYEDERRWATSPVGRALEQRKRESTDWNSLVATQLNRLEDSEAQRRIACFVAAQARAERSGKPWGSGVHPNHHHVRARRVVLVSGSTVLGSRSESGGGKRVGLSNLILDIALTKLAYARRHGYKFEFYGAEEFLDELYQARLPRWEFAKTFMLRKAWEKHAKKSLATGKEDEAEDVLVWSDYDVWWNPRHSSLPLTAFMDEAVGAPDKVVVMGPEKGLNTGFFLWRMTRTGRHFFAKWHQMVVSGVAECHGYDQAAFQMLVLQQASNSTATAKPPYTCKQPTCGGPNAGCNQLYYAGVRSTLSAAGFMTPTGHELDNGQVNQYFPLVHVINAADQHNFRSNGSEHSHRSENPRVDPEKPGKLGAQIPRMQCGSSICSRFDFFAAHKCFRSFYVMYVTMFGSPNCSITVDLSRGAVGSRFSVQAAHETSVWQPP